jgi:hypothetical protein
MIPRRRLLLALSLVAGALRAETPPPSAPNATARALFQEGLVQVQQGDLTHALHLFEAAYAARPHFSVLFNIAQARAALGQPVEAVAALERYLADGAKQISEKRRSEVHALIAASQAHIGHLRFHGGSPAARVWLDGVELSAEQRDQDLPLAKGPHSVLSWHGAAPPSAETISLGDEPVVYEIADAVSDAPRPVGARLAIDCQVLDVKVEVLGVGVVHTPQARPLAVPAGLLTVRFSRPGYPLVTRTVVMVDGDVSQVECDEAPLSPVPAPLAAKLLLDVKPSDAELSIDGQPYGGQGLPAGRHRLQVHRHGFLSAERTISLEAGKQLIYSVTLVETAAERDRLQRERAHSRTVALILGGLGVAALGASAGVYAWNSQRFDDWQARRKRGAATSNEVASVQRADDAALGLLIAGGALSAGGAWVAFTTP